MDQYYLVYGCVYTTLRGEFQGGIFASDFKKAAILAGKNLFLVLVSFWLINL